jgi:hypothetical protein
MINPRPETDMESCVPPFWRLLNVFFEPDRLDRWRAEIFKDPSDVNKASDGCYNNICLCPNANDMWSRGLFALKPIFLSGDEKELTVEFYWQPKPSHGGHDSVDLLKLPSSSKDLAGVEENFLAIRRNDKPAFIRSGDVFIFTTTNPITHPLPSFELLEMQWHLQRIVSMSGAAEVYDEWDNGDYDNYCDDTGAVHRSPLDILSWIPLPGSYATNEGENDWRDSSATTVSAGTSPLKTREASSQANVLTPSPQSIAF